jgi:4-hydroxybenzoate polyprenyltransferase
MTTHQIKNYLSLMRLDKPVGIVLLLWPTLWALWLAGAGNPDKKTVAIFILGVIIMRSAGCVINDMADRHFDEKVTRTCQRPLAAGEMTMREAMIILSLLLSAALSLVCFLNQLTILLAFIGVILAGIYPFLKRITHLPQLWLGAAFSWGVPMAFEALTGTVPAQSWLLFLTAAVWPVIYDTQYAMVDRPDDIKIGVRSTAILFGEADRYMIGALQIIFIILLALAGAVFRLNMIYDMSLAGVAALFIYQQILIKHRVPGHCFKAFLNHRWVGAVIFLGIISGHAYHSG